MNQFSVSALEVTASTIKAGDQASEKQVLAEVFKYVIWAISPLGVWILGTLLALVGVFGRRRLKRWVLVLSFAQLVAFSTQPVADALLGTLENEAKVLEQACTVRQDLGVIVLLGGMAESRFDGVRDLPDLTDSADRLWTAVLLHRQGVAKQILVSGGRFTDDPRIESEADSMARFLIDMGVPPEAIVKESASRTTLENALYTRSLLQAGMDPDLGPDGLGTGGTANLDTQSTEQHKPKGLPQAVDLPAVALVTSAFHLPRAVRLFESVGLQVCPFRADIRVTPEDKPVWQQLPKPDSLDRSTMAIKELLGRLQLWVADWFQ